MIRRKPAPQNSPPPGAEKTLNGFIERHIGPSEEELPQILKSLNVSSLEELIKKALPEGVCDRDGFSLPSPLSEREALREIQIKAQKNQIFKDYIGMGYKPSVTPAVIQRNILENPVWYSSYTPYQAELAQGRLEALLNFQTMTADLTGMEIANASLLDEGTALAEALALAKSANDKKPQAKKFFVDSKIFPQTLDVLKTRCEAWGWVMETGAFEDFKGGEGYFSAILQYPDAEGSVKNIEKFLKSMALDHCVSIVASDLLSLTLLRPPGEMGADIVAGTSQNFGVPLFFGGPHAGFFATKKEFIRLIPGRIVGVSKDRQGQRAFRLTLQTREQHIRREKATSNICTSQALLAVMAGFYAVYHGPQGLKKIAVKIHRLTGELCAILHRFKDIKVLNSSFFDTLSFRLPSRRLAVQVYKAFQKEGINLRFAPDSQFSLALNERAEEEDIEQIQRVLESALPTSPPSQKAPLSRQKSGAFSPGQQAPQAIPEGCLRSSPFLQHPVFNSYHTETELLRYIHRLQNKELSLAHSMIPLGSCTMKLNATAELSPVSWPAFSDIHPFAPAEQSRGYRDLLAELEDQLCEITGFKAFSFQPNAGSQGEYAGLLAIKKYHGSRKESHRNICLIPSSAHGTNPASAIMAGFQTVPLACAKDGRIDRRDLDDKLKRHGKNLAGAMITYPSTYGFFEEGIQEICHRIHQEGGLVYLDGANMNALLGICRPARLGFDVCHLNLHKTFCIPHGGGGPGAGPVGVNEKLKDFLPGHFCFPEKTKAGAISSAPYGSAGILLISWIYIKLMGGEGLKRCAQTAIANANYIAQKLQPHYRVLFTGPNGFVAHECVIDLRKFKHSADITADDVAKRLIDYSFHAPTMSWPVPGTLMIEPTESESKKEMDRFCSALISIREEIRRAERDKSQRALLKSAPHNLKDAVREEWPFPYSKREAFYPLPWLYERKFWPPVSRIENAFGDIHPFCSCPPVLEPAES